MYIYAYIADVVKVITSELRRDAERVGMSRTQPCELIVIGHELSAAIDEYYICIIFFPLSGLARPNSCV